MALSSEIDLVSSIDFQLNNLWDFMIFPNVTSDLAAQAASLNLYALTSSVTSSAADVIMKYKVVSTTIPLPSLAIEKTKYGRKHYQSRNYEGDFTVTIMEDSLFSTYSFFRNWMEQIYDFELNQWQLVPTTKTGMLIFYSGIGVPTAIFTFKNLMIQGIGDIGVQRSSSGPLTYTVSFSFEKMDFDSPVSDVLGSIKNAVANTISTFQGTANFAGIGTNG
jgi:hypothetical protein